MSRRPRRIWISHFACGLCAAPLAAKVHVPAIFSAGAVLQLGTPVPVWGSAEPEERVTVEYAAQQKSAVAGSEGKWRVTLDPLIPGPAGPLVIRGTNRTTIQNVVAGEVWFLSWQSNMEFALFHCQGGEEAIANSANPNPGDLLT